MDRLEALGYEEPEWKIVYAADFGVPQLRPRSVLVAFRDAADRDRFEWPDPVTPNGARVTVGEALKDLVESKGWLGAERWATKVQLSLDPRSSAVPKNMTVRTSGRRGHVHSGSVSALTVLGWRTTALHPNLTGRRTSRSSSTSGWLPGFRASPTPGR